MGPPTQGSPARHVQYQQNPGPNYNPMSPTNQGVYMYGQPTMNQYPMPNYGMQPMGPPHHMMGPMGGPEQQVPPEQSIQNRESMGRMSVSGPGMVSATFKSLHAFFNCIITFPYRNFSTKLFQKMQQIPGPPLQQLQQASGHQMGPPGHIPPLSGPAGQIPQSQGHAPGPQGPPLPQAPNTGLPPQGPGPVQGPPVSAVAPMQQNQSSAQQGPPGVPQMQNALQVGPTQGPPQQMQYQPPIVQSAPPENVQSPLQQKQEQKLDTAELISFD